MKGVRIMSFRNWLYETLIGEDIIDPVEIDVDELDIDILIATTDLEENDIDNYRIQFEESCRHEGITPDFDI